ncbi:MAG: type IV secretory system conjugative DNA transfer family protein [Acetobacteraceae bacterium]
MSDWATNGGVYLGHHVDRTEGPPAPGAILRYKGDRHICWIGNSGAGKSRRLLVPNLAMLTGWSALVIDPKGDLLRMCGPHRAAHGAENVVFDPFGMVGNSRGCNVLQALDSASDDFADDAMGQAEGIIETGNTNEPHWAESFQDFLAAVAMFVRLVIPGGTYGDVRALLAQPDAALRDMIMAPDFTYNGVTYPGMITAGIDHDWEEIGHKAARFGSISPENRELHSILSTGLTQTRFLDSRAIKRELAGPAFDFTVMKEKPVTVWLILPARRLITHSKWLRLILTTAIQQLMGDTKKAQVPVAIICDEAAALGHLPILENTVALMRGYGLKLITIWQDLAQLRAIYKDRWESFIGNAGVLQSFAAQDVSTAEYLSQRTGQTTRQAVSTSLTHNMQAGTPLTLSSAASTAPIPVPLMMPQDIRNMDDGYTVLFSHHIKGTARAYLPYPTQIPGMQDIMALDPSA